MGTNYSIKFLQKLLNKKYRQESDLFFIEGRKIFLELIKENIPYEHIFATNEFCSKNSDLAIKYKPTIINNTTFNKLSALETPPGLIAYIKKEYILSNVVNDNNLLMINKISDPGNLGTIIRIADWFGFKEIIISKECVELFNPKVVQASMGSIFHIKFIIDVNSLEIIKQLKQKGYQILVADLQGENIYKTNLTNKKNIFVFSNEANGPEKQILSLADKILTIPSFGKAESLNVAVSTGIILSHFINQIQGV